MQRALVTASVLILVGCRSTPEPPEIEARLAELDPADVSDPSTVLALLNRADPITLRNEIEAWIDVFDALAPGSDCPRVVDKREGGVGEVVYRRDCSFLLGPSYTGYAERTDEADGGVHLAFERWGSPEPGCASRNDPPGVRSTGVLHLSGGEFVYQLVYGQDVVPSGSCTPSHTLRRVIDVAGAWQDDDSGQAEVLSLSGRVGASDIGAASIHWDEAAFAELDDCAPRRRGYVRGSLELEAAGQRAEIALDESGACRQQYTWTLNGEDQGVLP